MLANFQRTYAALLHVGPELLHRLLSEGLDGPCAVKGLHEAVWGCVLKPDLRAGQMQA